MSDDPQDQAEQFDEDLLGGDPIESMPGGTVTSDETIIDFPPDRPLGIPHAESDVTDESLEERVAQEEPDVFATDLDDDAADIDDQEP